MFSDPNIKPWQTKPGQSGLDTGIAEVERKRKEGSDITYTNGAAGVVTAGKKEGSGALGNEIVR